MITSRIWPMSHIVNVSNNIRLCCLKEWAVRSLTKNKIVIGSTTVSSYRIARQTEL